MELSVFERLLLLNILPREGNITTLRIVRELREELSFTEEEHKRLDFQAEGTQVRWKTEAESPKEVKIGETAKGLIRDSLAELNKQNKLTLEHLPIYERFVENKQNGKSAEPIPQEVEA